MVEKEEWLLLLLSELGCESLRYDRLKGMTFVLDKTLRRKGSHRAFRFDSWDDNNVDVKLYNLLQELENDGLIEMSKPVAPSVEERQGPNISCCITPEGEEKVDDIRSDLGFWNKRAVDKTISRWQEYPTNSMMGYVRERAGSH